MTANVDKLKSVLISSGSNDAGQRQRKLALWLLDVIDKAGLKTTKFSTEEGVEFFTWLGFRMAEDWEPLEFGGK